MSDFLTVRFADDGHDLLLEISHPDDSLEGGFDAEAQEEAVLARLDDLGEELSALRSLTVRPRPDYAGDLDRSWLADGLADCGLESLERLSWGNDDAPCFVEVPDLSALLASTPRLRSLRLAGEWEEENPELPAAGLTELSLLALRPTAIECIAEMDLTAVERLELRLYDYENEGEPPLELDELAPLFDLELPTLRAFCTDRCPFGPALVAALPDASWFAALTEVGLDGATDDISYLPSACGEALLGDAWSHVRVDITGAFCDWRRPPTEAVQGWSDASGGRLFLREPGA